MGFAHALALNFFYPKQRKSRGKAAADVGRVRGVKTASPRRPSLRLSARS
jgi:hypothetical protein